MRSRSWSDNDLVLAVKQANSIRQVLLLLHLVPAGGNYNQVNKRIQELSIRIDHFHGKGWRKGQKFPISPRIPLLELLRRGSTFQSYKLKARLIQEGIKKAHYELCGWAKQAEGGRIPVELDHINGDNTDNRLEDLRILCPNCHSLQPTHRGRNKARWRNR